MLRRPCLSVLLCFLVTRGLACSQSSGVRTPQFWVAERGEARVFIFGFGDAKDRSWLTPSIQKAFQESSQVWLETAGPGAPDNRDATEKEAAAQHIEKLAHESGRTLFDVLEPSVRSRTLAYLTDLGITRESIETLRPWRAYYSIVGAFYSKTKLSYEPVSVEAVLEEMARSSGKYVNYELPTREAFVNFMAAMPDKAQSQYIEWLLDFLDDYKKGVNDDEEMFSWIAGKPSTRTLDRMRTKMPDLYRVMQPQRNQWWARTISELLATKGSTFVAVGQLHVLGPDGIPHQLERLGVNVRLLP